MTKPHRIDAFAGMRGLAAFSVAFHHLPHLHVDEAINQLLRDCMRGPGCGVPFFFVISGFVLAYRYHMEFTTPTKAGVVNYYTGRFARIWPVHLFTLFLAFFYSPNPLHQNRLDAAVVNACLIQTWLPNSVYTHSFNSVTWSLSIEIFFYLALPFIVWRLPTFNHIQGLAICVIAWLVPFSMALYLIANPTPWEQYLVVYCPVTRMGEFLIGVVIGLFYVRNGSLLPAHVSRSSTVLWSLLEASTVVVAALFVYSGPAVPQLLRSNGYYTLPVAAIIGVFAFQRGLLSNVFTWSGLRYFGEISFAFFMVHCIVFVCLNSIFPGPMPSWSRANLYLLVAAAVAVVVHHVIEIPASRILVRIANPIQKQSTCLPEGERKSAQGIIGATDQRLAQEA